MFNSRRLRMDSNFTNEVLSRLTSKPWLIPVFSDVHDICNRIREIDPTLFIARNDLGPNWECHSTAHYPHTYAWIVPWKDLDSRVLDKARENCVERSAEAFAEIDEFNRRHEASMQRAFETRNDNLAREHQKEFAKTAWEVL
jgi:hypothetical protein